MNYKELYLNITGGLSGSYLSEDYNYIIEPNIFQPELGEFRLRGNSHEGLNATNYKSWYGTLEELTQIDLPEIKVKFTDYEL